LSDPFNGQDHDDRGPPLSALRAFESAARHMSFARAAEELGVSPAAISQHIQALEAYAGQPLFRRLGRRIELTDAGAAARPLAAEAMLLLALASRAMRLTLRSARVAVSAPPSFAQKWLAPRLGAFQHMHPDTDVWISADVAPVDFAVADADLSIRFGRGGYDAGHAEVLISEALAPVCAPGLMLDPALTDVALLHDDTAEADPCPGWPVWLAEHGLDTAAARRGLRFNQSSLVLEAAMAGQGLALARTRLAERDVAAGRLVYPFGGERRLGLGHAYHLVWPRGRTLSPAVKAFMAWLRAEAAASDAPDLGGGI
jgi:LysR family transcriptional regulator, glycine cleavage system transcriptional activator